MATPDASTIKRISLSPAVRAMENADLQQAIAHIERELVRVSGRDWSGETVTPAGVVADGQADWDYAIALRAVQLAAMLDRTPGVVSETIGDYRVQYASIPMSDDPMLMTILASWAKLWTVKAGISVNGPTRAAVTDDECAYRQPLDASRVSA